MEVAAFWIFLAAIIVAAEWRKKHIEAARYETMRLIIEKNQNLDAEQLKELLSPYSTPSPFLVSQLLQKSGQWSGNAYKGLRMFGTIIMFVALGLAIAGIWMGSILGIHDRSVVDIGVAIPIVALVGAGLFFASRFVTKPPSDENRD